MNENIKMNEIKRQVYLSFTQDGLLDLAIGLVIAGFAAVLMAGFPWMVALLGGIPLMIWYLGKRYLTLPRSGSFVLDKSMKSQFTKFSFSTLAAGIAVLVFFLLFVGLGKSILMEHPLALFGLILALGISAMGVLVKTPRFHIYAALVFISMAGGEILNKSIETVDMFLLSVFLAGGIIIISGIIVLSGFLKKYPVVTLGE